MYLETMQIVQLSGALLAAILIFVRCICGAAQNIRWCSSGPSTVSACRYDIRFLECGHDLRSGWRVNAKGRLQYVPMLGAVIAVILAYMISMSQLPRSLYDLHGIEIIALVSRFWCSSSLTTWRESQKTHGFIINVLIANERARNCLLLHSDWCRIR